MLRRETPSLDEMRKHAIYERGLGSVQKGNLVFFLVTRENTGFLVWRVDCLDGAVPPGTTLLGWFVIRESALEVAVNAVNDEKRSSHGSEI